MHVNLYSHKQLQYSIKSMLAIGMFLVAGGIYALIREIALADTFRLGWTLASAAVLLAGLACFFIGNNRHIINEAYFSMNPECIKYRLAVFARERIIYWKDIYTLEISAHTITFNLKSGKSIKMRLGNIQQAEVMLHVSRSIHLAAVEKGIMINRVQVNSKQNSVA